MKNTRILHRGRYLSLIETSGWEFARRSNASGVVVLLPVTAQGELVLVEQYRIPVSGRVIELPTGLIGDQGNPGESALEAGRRELMEETGFAAGRMEVLFTCPSSAGMSDEMLTFVLATGLERQGPGGGDGSEDISVHLVPLAEVPRWIEDRGTRGIAADPKIYSALFLLGRQAGGHGRPEPRTA